MKLYVVILLVFTICLSDLINGQDSRDPLRSCMSTGDYTPNSTYSANLNAALSALSSNMTQYGFQNASVGRGEEDTAYAVALCQADVLLDDCRRCVEDGAAELVQSCANKKQAIKWFDQCMLHYSNLPMTGLQVNGADTSLWNGADVEDPVRFREARALLFDALRAVAANGSSLLKAGAGSRRFSDFETVYALLQCVPSLSFEECNNCLVQGIRVLPPASTGSRRLSSSCNIRYDAVLFFNETRLRELNVLVTQVGSDSPPGVRGGDNRGGGGDNRGGKKDDKTIVVVVIVVVSVVVCLLLVACGAVFLRRRRMKKMVRQIPERTEETSTVESLQYDFGQIKVATEDFSDANKLGEGGFGAVYKGELSNGQLIAVKRLSRDSGQGDREFKNEVLLVARLQHRNLVRLLGFSMGGGEKLLIYEFVPNGSLDQFIFDQAKRFQLNWQMRCKIIGGIARGLLYLHEDSRVRIIHRDLKPSNILLDREMNPKIADFGMARLFAQDQIQEKTNRVVGTFGYMPPEYALYGRFSIKSDVFSFGVLVLGIISGQKPISIANANEEDLLTFAWKNWREGTAENVIDPALRTGGNSIRDIVRCIHIGLLCVQENASDRPTMNSVVLMLSSSTITLPVTSRPAFVVVSSGSGSTNKVSNSSTTSNARTNTSESSTQNEISITELLPR